MKRLFAPTLLLCIAGLAVSTATAAAETAPVPQFRPPEASTIASPECAWVGRRVVASLLRDDVLAAEGFMRFYRDFNCPQDHVGRAFGCAVPAVGQDAAKLETRVTMCWEDPTYEMKEGDPGETDSGTGTAAPEKPAGDIKPAPETRNIAPVKPAVIIKPEPAAPSSTTYPKK